MGNMAKGITVNENLKKNILIKNYKTCILI